MPIVGRGLHHLPDAVCKVATGVTIGRESAFVGVLAWFVSWKWSVPIQGTGNARAGIPEYWILDPEQQSIRVLTLKGRTYRIHGDFGPGTQATSVLLPGLAVAVDVALAPPGSERTG